MKLYAEISKRDEESRMVWGYASTEATDSQGEVIKADAISAALADYMKFANIREMHQPSAVGVTKEAAMTEKGLFIGAHVVDDIAWNKVKAGVYKGFSIGGQALKRDDTNKNTITEIRLTEISLVDRPANPEALFELWKGDGMSNEMTKEQAVERLAEMLNKGEIDPVELVKSFEKKEEPKEEPKSEEEPKEEPKAEEKPKEEPKVDEEPKEEPKEELKEEPKEEPKSEEEPKEEPKAEEKPKEEPKVDEEPKEEPKEELKEEPKEEPKSEEEPKEEPKAEEKPKEEPKVEEDKKSKKSDSAEDLKKAEDFGDLLKAELAKADEKHAEEIAKFEKLAGDLSEKLEKMASRLKELEDIPAAAKGSLMSVSKASDVDSVAKEEEPADAMSAIKKIHQSGGIRFR